MTGEVPSQFDQTEASREKLQGNLEQLPGPVRYLYERVRGLVTQNEPGYDSYEVNVERFSGLLAEKGVYLIGAPLESVVVYARVENYADFPDVSVAIHRQGEESLGGIVALSTHGLVADLSMDFKKAVYIQKGENQRLNQAQLTALAFTEALLDSLRDAKGKRLIRRQQEKMQPRFIIPVYFMEHTRPQYLTGFIGKEDVPWGE